MLLSRVGGRKALWQEGVPSGPASLAERAIWYCLLSSGLFSMWIVSFLMLSVINTVSVTDIIIIPLLFTVMVLSQTTTFWASTSYLQSPTGGKVDGVASGSMVLVEALNCTKSPKSQHCEICLTYNFLSFFFFLILFLKECHSQCLAWKIYLSYVASVISKLGKGGWSDTAEAEQSDKKNIDGPRL